MPLYEFQCRRCDCIFEELTRMGSTGDDLLCPHCGADKVMKKMSTFYGRSSGGHGTASHNCGGGCGGNCGNCNGNCSCHH